MIKRKLILLAAGVLISFAVLAQNSSNYSVTGKVMDEESQEPLELATVSLLDPDDSTMIGGNTTDEEGAFEVNAGAGEYLLKVQYVSYQSKIIPGIQLNEENSGVALGEITLREASQNLDEVVVEGERSRMTMDKGKKIFNVGSDLTNAGASASDVLDRIPAVQVDIEGNVSLRGQGVRILVNGKPSGLVGITSNEALRYFPANQIEKVEVITNPSAKYEAAGSAGIINIILKDNTQWGLNGTFTAEAGYPKDHGGSVKVNYRNKWYNIFGNYSVNVDRNPGGGFVNQHFNYQDTSYFQRTIHDRSRGGLNHNFQFGSDFYFSPKDILKVSGVLGISDQNNYSDITYEDYTANRETFTQKTLRNEHEKEDEDDYELNFNFEKTFDDEDHVLTADVQLRNNIENEHADLEQRAGAPGEELAINQFQESINDTKVEAYLTKIDYVLPIGEEGEFEAGFRGEYRDIGNEYEVKQKPNEQADWEVLDEFTNTFFYNEGIYGAYVQYGNEIDDFSYQGGLRYEFTGISTLLQNTNEENNREYNNLFPSASLSYNLSQGNSIQLSYSRRLDRPHFHELNPFNTFNDNRNFRTGNPDLDPEFTGSYDLGYVINTKASSIYAGGFYRHTKGEIERISSVNDEGITIMKPENLATQDDYGIESRYSTDVFDWWRFNISADFYRQMTSGFAQGEDLSSDTYTMHGRASSNFDVKDWFEIEFSGFYRAPETEPQQRDDAMYMVNFGARKELFDGKGNISLSIRDLFVTAKFSGTVEGNNFSSYREFRWRDTQSVNLSFSYRLRGEYEGSRGGGGAGGGGYGDD